MANKRTRARRSAVQALYQWELTNQSPSQIEDAMPTDSNLTRTDLEYFRALITGVPRHLDEIDALLEPGLDRPMAELDPVERAVLRVACFELANRKDVPWRVVLDEAITTAKLFGSDNGYQLVNAVLDTVGEKISTGTLALSTPDES